jgi:hypothetical protein
MRERLAAVIGVLVFTICLASCGQAGEKALVGTWQELNGNDRVEFRQGSTFSGSMASGADRGQEQLSGTYFLEGDTIGIKLQDGSPMTWKFKLTGDDLVVTYVQGGRVKEDQSITKFRRVA